MLTLLGALAFYGFYKEWISWILLLAVLYLPWLSLLLSLPAMLTVKADLRCPEKTRMDMPVRTALQLRCSFPHPPVLCTIRLVNSLTGKSYLGKPGEKIPTDHCGKMTLTYPHMYAYDYLGLFRRRLHREQSMTVYIEPKPVPGKLPTWPEGGQASRYRPKPGGGFSEHHDLRLYRPGDDLRNIHWKMAAKTGKLIYREALEPVEKGHVLTLCLYGVPEELDKRLGRLLYLSQSLLKEGIAHTVLCRTGKGLVELQVRDRASLETAMQCLLGSPRAETDGPVTAENVLWQHRIGGDGHED